MPTRRRVLGALVGLPLAAAAFVGGRRMGPAVPLARPAPSGSSATRCGLCGSADHAMLRCPSAPVVR